MKKAICVYSSSSDAITEHYFAAARDLGKCMGQRNYTLVFGGGNIGLMGELARSIQRHGGKVIGIIPGFFNIPDIVYENPDQLIVTETMRERKAIMEEQSDAFIGLPGGFGTIEEMLEIITLKQIQVHDKPVVFLNIGNFYRHLLDLFERLYREQFAKPEHRQLYFVAPDVQAALSYIETYKPPHLPKKWF